MPYVPYRDSLEQQEEHEGQTTMELLETMRSISETTFKDSGERHAMRSVHVKSHGLLCGELVVPQGLPPEFAQGLFATPGTYAVVLRLSTPPGDILPDTISTPRAMAVKVVGVQGERLPGSEGDTTQDFLMVNGPAFEVPTAQAFLGNLKKLAKTTDRIEGFKVFVASLFRGTEKVLESVGGESSTLKSMGGHPATHPLGETYYTQVPFRFGDYVAKVSVAPASPGLTALTDQPVDLSHSPDALREAVIDFFAQQGGEWELRVQLCTDEKTMPIEKADVVWPEEESPYVTVARITVPPQSAWNPARAERVDDQMAFNPWLGLAAHRPLGSVNRARKLSYEMSRNFRGTHNGCPIHSPKTLGELP